MLTKKMVDSINEQIKWELYSAYLYLSMSAYSTSIGLNGFANWFYVQTKEEMSHAERFYNYLIQQGSKIVLQAIEQPPVDFKSPLNMFDETLKHEQVVTKKINNLVKLARDQKDYATEAALQWFVTEQVEEEANAIENLQKLKLIGKDANALLTIDSQLALRVFTPPAASGGQA